MPTFGSSRRAFIKTMGVVTAAATCGRAAAAKAQDYKPQEQKKLTQAAARYQDHPKGNESCGSCPYFVLPKSCVLVEGEISPAGWCPIYTTFSPLDRGGHPLARSPFRVSMHVPSVESALDSTLVAFPVGKPVSASPGNALMRVSTLMRRA